MKDRVISMKANINTFPTHRPYLDNGQFTIGDLHGNFLTHIWLLVSFGIVQLENELEDYYKLVRYYYTPIEKWDKNILDDVKNIIESASYNPKCLPIFLRYIGDETGDRGLLDYINLLIFKKLSTSIDFTIIASNHGLEMICNYERGEKFSKRAGLGCKEQRVSASNMQLLIDEGLITRKEVDELIKDYYIPHYKMVDHSVSTNNILNHYTHAPSGTNTLQELGKQLNVAIDISTLTTQLTSYQELQHEFEKFREKKEVHKLYLPGKYAPDEDFLRAKECLDDEPNTPFYWVVWRRDRDFLVRQKWEFYSNGHDMSQRLVADNVAELDNVLGKSYFNSIANYKFMHTYDRNTVEPTVDMKAYEIEFNNIKNKMNKRIAVFFPNILNDQCVYSSYDQSVLKYFFNDHSDRFLSVFIKNGQVDMGLIKLFNERSKSSKRFLHLFYLLDTDFILNNNIANKLLKYVDINNVDDVYHYFLISADSSDEPIDKADFDDEIKLIETMAGRMKEVNMIMEEELCPILTDKAKEKFLCEDKFHVYFLIKNILLLQVSNEVTEDKIDKFVENISELDDSEIKAMSKFGREIEIYSKLLPLFAFYLFEAENDPDLNLNYAHLSCFINICTACISTEFEDDSLIYYLNRLPDETIKTFIATSVEEDYLVPFKGDPTQKCVSLKIIDKLQQLITEHEIKSNTKLGSKIPNSNEQTSKADENAEMNTQSSEDLIGDIEDLIDTFDSDMHMNAQIAQTTTLPVTNSNSLFQAVAQKEDDITENKSIKIKK